MADYRRNNYSFVIRNNFKPLSLQEKLSAMALYKDSYDKAEAARAELSDKLGPFKYLRETLPEDSKARQVFDNYYNDFEPNAEDFSKNGLTIKNRAALSNLRNRYASEIGRLEEADKVLKKINEIRMTEKDPTMLYNTDVFTLDDFLDNNKPNLYSISGEYLYKRGVEAGKAAASRQYGFGDIGSIIDDTYRKIIQSEGYSAQSIAKFRQNISSIPELQQAALDIMRETGADVNLDAEKGSRAFKGIINGIIDGAVRKVSGTLQRDPNVLDKKDLLTMQMTMAKEGLKQDDNGNIYYDWKSDPSIGKDSWMYDEGPDGKPVLSDLGKAYLFRNSKEKEEKEETHTLRESTLINKDGIYHKIDSGTGGKDYGTRISFSEAQSKYPDIVSNYDPGYEEYYEYYENSSGLVIRRPEDNKIPVSKKKGAATKQAQSEENNEQNNGDNQL